MEEEQKRGEAGGGGVATIEAPPPSPVAAPARRRRRLPLILGLAAVLLLIAVPLAVLANNALSNAYSPSQAVLDYFKAQQSGDIDTMWAHATYLRGEGSYSAFFERPALIALMGLHENRVVSNVQVTSVKSVDSNTSDVTVSLKWNGVQRSLTLALKRDASNTHWLFYPSWRVQIPSTTIYVTLPNQPGTVAIDDIGNPAGASSSTIEAIMGFHQVQMQATDLYDSSSQLVDAIQPARVTLQGNLSATVVDDAKNAVRDTLTNSCDVKKYGDCPGHTYTAPDQNYIYYMPVPGHGNVDYTKYLFTLTGDPTTGMTMTVGADAGKVSVSGSCSTTLTVNGSQRYNLKGTYTGTLTWTSGGFNSDLNVYCDQSAA